MYGPTPIRDAFRETKLHDRANRRAVEHSGLRSLWELPRTASRAREHVYSRLYYCVVLFEMFKWFDKKSDVDVRITNYFL